MEKQGVQLELFSKDKGAREIKRRPFNLGLLLHFRNHEKFVFFIILLSITGIISFSLGVERGKKINTASSRIVTGEQINAETKIIREPVLSQAAEQQNFMVKKDTALTAPFSETKKNYTIQLASYKTASYAQKEADALKKKGFTTLVMPKGKYIVLCVGNFSDKDTAQPVLSGLKKKYEGCYIRRL